MYKKNGTFRNQAIVVKHKILCSWEFKVVKPKYAILMSDESRMYFSWHSFPAIAGNNFEILPVIFAQINMTCMQTDLKKQLTFYFAIFKKISQIISTKEWQGSPKRSKAYKLLSYLITDIIYITCKKCR